MGIRHEQVLDEIIVLDCCGLLATTATALGTVISQRLALDVTGMR